MSQKKRITIMLILLPILIVWVVMEQMPKKNAKGTRLETSLIASLSGNDLISARKAHQRAQNTKIEADRLRHQQQSALQELRQAKKVFPAYSGTTPPSGQIQQVLTNLLNKQRLNPSITIRIGREKTLKSGKLKEHNYLSQLDFTVSGALSLDDYKKLCSFFTQVEKRYTLAYWSAYSLSRNAMHGKTGTQLRFNGTLSIAIINELGASVLAEKSKQKKSR